MPGKINPLAVGWDSGVPFSLTYRMEDFDFNFKFFVRSLISVVFVNNVNVKRSSKISENSFLKNGL